MCKYDVFVQEGGYRLSLSPDHLQSHKNCSQVPQGVKLKISEMYDLKGVDLFGWGAREDTAFTHPRHAI